MAITDYIPNIFGQAPGTYQGLLGAGLITPEQLQQTQSRANIQGLLGAGLALAQGMSRIGPRRSAAENILAALSGGMAAGGGAFDQSLKNIALQQQLQSAALTQKQALDRQTAIAAAGREDPALAQLLLIDPAEGAKQLALKRQLGTLGGQAGAKTPASLRAQAQQVYGSGNAALKPLGDSLMEEANRLELMPSQVSQPQDQQVQPTQVVPEVEQTQAVPSYQAVPGFGVQPFMTGAVEPQEAQVPVQVNSQTGEQILPVVSAVDKRPKSKLPALNAKAESIIAEMDRLSDPRLVNNPLVAKAFETQEKRLEQIRKQMAEVAVSEVDLESFRKTAPPMFQGAIDNLMQLQINGKITPDKLVTEMREINKQITDFTQKELEFKRKQADFSVEARRIAKNKFKKNLEDLTDEETGQLDRIMFGKEGELRKLGRTIVTQSVIAEKELTKGRAGAVVKAEESAFNAMNTASDVRAIVDILKPYQGGKLDEFKASIGSYLPNTSLAQIATASDLSTAIRNRLAPTLRVEGSGATSDFEAKSYLNAIPSLIQYPEGRELMAVYAERLAERAARAADLRAQMVQTGDFSIENFRREMKNQGLDRVFTNDEIAQLTKSKTAPGGSTLPADVKRKYGIKD